MDKIFDWLLRRALTVLQGVKERRDAAYQAESESIHADVQSANEAARKEGPRDINDLKARLGLKNSAGGGS